MFTIIKKTLDDALILPLLIGILLLWSAVFYSGISTAINVWSVSEIFAHCFLVLPCSLYFIYLKRQQLQKVQISPNYWLLPAFIGTLFLQLFAEIGDIKVFQHIATFTALPLLIWMTLGNKAAMLIKFPLFFIVFSIPIGEQLIPLLQDITTNLAVPLIKASQVPIFRNGYYLDIPQGRFLVAEACSGISFLIASIVFGCLYAYISFSRLYKQLIFIGVSILLPILANAVRVYGIVLTAYLSDMEYAAGADHLIYGGVFYSFILFLLIIIGERYRDKDFSITEDKSNESLVNNQIGGNFRSPKSMLILGFIILSLITVQQSWKYSISHGDDFVVNIADHEFEQSNKGQQRIDWQPVFKEPAASLSGQKRIAPQITIEYFISAHTNQTGELISSQNYLFNNERWSLLSKEKISLGATGSVISLLTLVSAQGKYRYVATWYQLDDQVMLSKIKMKLFDAFELLMGNQPVSSIYAFSIKGRGEQEKNQLLTFLEEHKVAISQVLQITVRSRNK